jgi:membrane fusion protein (multidrug efflux system)
MDSRENPPAEVAKTDDDEIRTGPRKRVIFGVLGGIALIVAIIFGVKYYLYARVHESTDDARVDASQVEINSKISERVKEILIDTNDPVKKGQLLIVLDTSDEQARLAQARANYDLALANQHTLSLQGQGGVAAAFAEVGGSEAGTNVAGAQVLAAESQVPAAQQNYQKAMADLARTESLVSTGDVPRQNLDAARATAAAAAAQLRSAQAQVSVAQANENAASQNVSAAQGGLLTARGKLAQSNDPSQVESQKAALDLARQSLAYTRIVSPINGYIGEKSVEVGQTVSPGMALMTVIPDDVFVTANFKETQLGSMRPGQPVDIGVDAYKGVTFHGHVLSINPASQNTYALVPAQNATGNFVKVTQRIPVKIGFDSDYDKTKYPMRPGMSVEASVKVR